MKKIIITGVLVVASLIAGGKGNNKPVDIVEVDNYSYVVEYKNGKKEKFTYDNELECAENYSNMWYNIFE
ncbi:hypothetical protein [Terrisporobacter sp.]|uniref:hypothetical protein n=1 Tax=Terrisporobacter sp. TaxID=1965305 RepID=UPI0039968E2E